MKPNTPTRALGAKPLGAKPAAEKARPIAYCNWVLAGADGKPLLKADGTPVLKSIRGFSIFDNEHCSLEEKALHRLAVAHGGEAEILVVMRVIVAKERPSEIDITDIPVMAKAV